MSAHPLPEPAPRGPDGGPLRVRVAILTYRRPELLANLLPQVLTQVDELRAWTGGPADVLVVDNDPECSARELCAGTPGVVYVSEKTPGIPAGRHRALAESAEDDLLQFIDDDEEPAPAWLVTMVRTWAEHDQPAVVAGSVRTRFLTPPTDWIVAGRFFDRSQPETGTSLGVAASGNMLIDVAEVRRLGVQFDPALGLHGGSDTLFSMALNRAGGRMIFCREAAIYDLVPPERSNREWVLQRSWHHGQTRSQLAVYSARSRGERWRARVKFVVGALPRFLLGICMAGLGLAVRSDRLNARGLWWVHRARGLVSGALGRAVPKYHRPGV